MMNIYIMRWWKVELLLQHVLAFFPTILNHVSL